MWIGGSSPLDVEGFRSHGRPIMQAYRYFWRNGHVIGRARAGTMGFDSQHGRNHWHFEQFAEYRLLTAGQKLALRSRKVGFCIAPTDNVDMALPHATWQEFYTGFFGECGTPTALWVREMLPVDWGKHLLPVGSRAVVRRHPSAERDLLHRGDRQPRAGPA